MKKKYLLSCITVILMISIIVPVTAGASGDKSVTKVPPWLRDNAPVVSITNPANGAIVDGIVHITVTASDDNGLTSVIISVNGEDHEVLSTLYYDWDTSGLADGDYTIVATATDTADKTSTDSVTVTIGEPAPPPTGDGIVNKFAIIIGISDYNAISDLSFCDEDATDWYNYLSPKGYQITLLGDHSSNYPQFDGLATEYNIKQTVANVLSTADADDIVVFASSGHGTAVQSGTGRNRVYYPAICCWDTSSGQDGEDGLLYDAEFKTMWAPAAGNVFIFLDHCYSGGMAGLFTNDNAGLFYMTTTCTDDGYGYDVTSYSNGAWTYYYLELGLVTEGYTDLQACFDYAHGIYPYDGGDEPQEFGTAVFTL
ncbi:MAG: Ig-like domain-containing protein [Candidatus Hodarchaeales archaeon]